MIRIGPITIMLTSTRLAYRVLSNRAYALHQVLWYTDDYAPPTTQEAIRLLDSELSTALSHVPAADIDSLE